MASNYNNSKQSSSAKASSSKASASGKNAMDRLKSEVASDMGVNIKNGYNGDITAKEAGSVGGEMVKRMISNQKNQMK